MRRSGGFSKDRARRTVSPRVFSEAKNEGQCCTVVAERVRARQDRNPNPSRLRAGNHVIDQSTLVAERPAVASWIKHRNG